MVLMIFILFSTFFLTLLTRVMVENGKRLNGIYFLVIAACILIFISGLRINICDTTTYIGGYEQCANKTLQEYLLEKGDAGFYFITYILYEINPNPQFYIFLLALVTQVLYIKFFLRYKTNLELCFYIYIASGCYFVTMNGVRQAFAAALILLTTGFIIKKKFGIFLIVTLLISTVHQSAIIMIPVFFLARMKSWSKKVFIFIGIAVVGTLLFYELLPLLEAMLKGSNYEHYIKSFTEISGDGANFLRVLVASVPPILAFINRNNIKDTMENRVFINISVINMVFMLFSLNTWVLARFTMYFNLYNFVLLPNLILTFKNKKERAILYRLLLIFYFIFFLKEQSTAERILFYKF